MPFLSPMARARASPRVRPTPSSPGGAALVGGERVAEGDAQVLGGVVGVDVQVAGAVDIQVDQPVAGGLIEHMVKETDAGAQLGLAGAVEVDAHADAGLGGVAADLGDAVERTGQARRHEGGGGHEEAWSAASICALSSALPTVRRRQLLSKGCIVETFRTKTFRVFMPSYVRLASATRTSTMLAWLSQHFAMPGNWRSAPISRSRWVRSSVAWAANTGACSSANSAVSQLSRFTL